MRSILVKKHKYRGWEKWRQVKTGTLAVPGGEFAKKIPFVVLLVVLVFKTGCGGPSVCGCKTEAAKVNPDRKYMEDCGYLYKGKSYEEVEAELARCVE